MELIFCLFHLFQVPITSGDSGSRPCAHMLSVLLCVCVYLLFSPIHTLLARILRTVMSWQWDFFFFFFLNILQSWGSGCVSARNTHLFFLMICKMWLHISLNWCDIKPSQKKSPMILCCVNEGTAPLLWSLCAIKGLKASAGCNSSSRLFMGHACLVHCGCYSVLDTNVAASLLQRAAPLFSPCCAARPCEGCPCATQPLTLKGMHYILFYLL